jgi:hypothetical protein
MTTRPSYRPDELEFDIETKEVSIKIGGKEHIVREATGAVAAAYRNSMLRGARLGPDGKSMHMEGGAEAEHVLVQGCLFDKSGRRYTLATIASWPNRVIKPIFKIAHEISDLKEADTEEGLERQLKDTQEKLDKMRTSSRNGKRGEDSEGTDPTSSSPESTTPGSPLPSPLE